MSARRDERGSGTFLMVGVMAVVAVVAAVGIVVAGYVAAVHQARAAADLAALSGASAYQQGRNACAAARPVAQRDGARLVACSLAGDPVDFVVSVTVEVEVSSPWLGLPRAVPARAHAGPVTGGSG